MEERIHGEKCIHWNFRPINLNQPHLDSQSSMTWGNPESINQFPNYCGTCARSSSTRSDRARTNGFDFGKCKKSRMRLNGDSSKTWMCCLLSPLLFYPIFRSSCFIKVYFPSWYEYQKTCSHDPLFYLICIRDPPWDQNAPLLQCETSRVVWTTNISWTWHPHTVP